MPSPRPTSPRLTPDTQALESEGARARRAAGSLSVTELRRSRPLIYAFLFVSGAVALTFQVVWQRYLSFLVGSEARSISLVVAVFLLGLAAGYRFWGNLTERNLSRRTLLKTVGYIELGIALYALTFPQWFGAVKAASYVGPDSLAFDFLITALLVLLPTFGMGASIPLLTAAVPVTAEEVSYCHARIYGINTLGAFFGAMIAGFYLVPTFGLPVSLALGAAANLFVALYFLANSLQGPAHKAEDVPLVPNRFGAPGIYLFVFVTGAVSIAYEILFMRVLGLSIGSGHYIFPTVVGVVILGLAIGSLSLRRGSISADRVMVEIVRLSALLAVVYLTVPYWPYWLSHLRVSLTSIPSNYPVFMALVVLFVAAMLLPVVIPMGRLLPIGYALIDKSRTDYGKVCGRVYFVNTLGTVAGAVGLAYVLFLFLDLEAIFKVNLALMLGLAAFLYFRHGRRRAAVVCCFLVAGVFALPQWNRQLHYWGIFRTTTVRPYHFAGLLRIPERVDPDNVVFFRDDPGVTVAVAKHRFSPHGEEDGSLGSAAIVVNGKSDGDTIADYSNMALTGVLPYLFAPQERSLDTVVIGLGTGITSGVLAGAPDIASVTTLEISPAVIEAVHRRGLFDEGNFQLSSSPRSRVLETDAFRYFARTTERYDLVISEPSNPWVVGVDNLFSLELYGLARGVLREGGVFFQWVQLYELTPEIFSAILRNVVSEFDHVRLFVIGPADVGILASQDALHGPHFARRWGEPHVRRVLYPIGLEPGAPFHLLEPFAPSHLRAIADSYPYPAHTLVFPWLGHAAGRARFLAQSVDLDRLLSHREARQLAWHPGRRASFQKWLHQDMPLWAERCAPDTLRHSTRFLCSRVARLIEFHRELEAPLTPARLMERLEAYNGLRSYGLLTAEIELLDEARDVLRYAIAAEASPVADELLLRPDLERRVIFELARQYALEGEIAEAAALASELYEAGRLSTRDFEILHSRLEDAERALDELSDEM